VQNAGDRAMADNVESCALPRETLFEIAAALSIPENNRDHAVAEIAKTIAFFQQHGCGSLDYFSPRRIEQFERISAAADALVNAISEADDRTILELGIISNQSDNGLDFSETARLLAAIAKKPIAKKASIKKLLELEEAGLLTLKEPEDQENGAADNFIEKMRSLSGETRKGRGHPRSPGLGDEGLPAHVWFIKDMARLARALGGRFPADKNDKGSLKWERLRGLIDPLLPKGFFKGLSNGSRSAIVKEAIVTEKNYKK
jgi:hypothetical protein